MKPIIYHYSFIQIISFLLLITGTEAATAAAASNSSALNGNNSIETTTATANRTTTQDFADVILSYFRFQGVGAINLILCPDDVSTLRKKKKLHSLLQHFFLHDFYVRVMKGNIHCNVNDIDKMLSRAQYHYPPPKTYLSKPLCLDLPRFPYKIGILMLSFNTTCALNVLRWSSASENNYFTTNRFWLLISETSDQIQIMSNDKKLFLPPDSEVRVLIWPKNVWSTMEFSLIDIYKVIAEKPMKSRIVGQQLVSVRSLIVALQKFGSAISYRENLEGTTFNTARVLAFPDLFTNIEDTSMRHIDTILKVNNRLIVEMANKLNIHFNTYQTDNYGWLLSNGTFSGLMGRYQRYELDFGQIALFMRLERVGLVDFIAETFRIRAGIIFRQPPLSAVANIFAMPFENDVWISVLTLIIITTLVFMVELKLSPITRDMHYWDCAIFVWGAACQQGFHVNMRNRSGRIIIFTTFIATLFLFTSFSANIVALLQSPSQAIRSLNDLTDSPLEIGMQETAYNKLFFNESTDPTTKNLFNKKIVPKGDDIYMKPNEGIEKMRTSLFAYQVELQAGYKIISDTFSEPEKCGLNELEPFQLPMLSFQTRKNFPYKELFRRQIRWQREVGLMRREELKWVPQKPKCEGGSGGFLSIGLTECRYTLAIFGCGILIAFAIFFCELAIKCITTAKIK